MSLSLFVCAVMVNRGLHWCTPLSAAVAAGVCGVCYSVVHYVLLRVQSGFKLHVYHTSKAYTYMFIHVCDNDFLASFLPWMQSYCPFAFTLPVKVMTCIGIYLLLLMGHTANLWLETCRASRKSSYKTGTNAETVLLPEFEFWSHLVKVITSKLNDNRQ